MATDTWERCADALETLIESIGLTHNGRTVPVHQRTIPNVVSDTLPTIFISFEGEAEQVQDAAFGEYDVIYPFHVWIVDRRAENDDTLRTTYQRWRKQIIDKLQPLDRLTDSAGEIRGVWDVQVSPFMAFDPQLPKYQYLASGLSVRVFTREAAA